MKKQRPTMIYRTILLQAWSKTWQRKSLWVFALFAAILMNGGLFDTVIRSIQHIERTGTFFEDILAGSVLGIQVIGEYIQQIQTLDQTRVFVIVTTSILVALFLLSASILSQYALVQGVGEKKESHPHKLRRQALHACWDVLAINLFVKIASFILTLVTALTLILFIQQATIWYSLLVFVVFFFFIPLIIIINTIGMFAIINTVREKTHTLDAIHHAYKLFSQHWIASLEFGLSLFLLIFGTGILLLAISFFLLIPFWMLTLAALYFGSIGLYLSLHVIAVVFFIVIFLLFVGISTTFQYASWVGFYARMNHKTYGAKCFAKLTRLLSRG